MSAHDRSPRRARRALVVVVLSTLLTLVVAEALLRAAGLPKARDPEEFFGEAWTFGRFVRHPRRFYTVAPHHRQSDALAGRFATGAWPYRGRPAEPFPEGGYRIAVLGDSCIYGFALDVRDTIPELLRTGLVARGWDTERTQVLNLGVMAYGLVQILRLAQEELDRYEPDLVIFYPAAWNDQSPALWRNDLIVLDETGLGSIPGLGHSSLYGMLELALERMSGERLSRAEVVQRWRAGDPPFGERTPEDVLPSLLDRLFVHCRDTYADTLVVVPAHPAHALENFPRVARDAAAVHAAAQRAGLPVVDARTLFPEPAQPGAEPGFFIDQVHYNPRGTRRVAAAAVEWVDRELGATARASMGEVRPPGGAELRIVGVEPARVLAFGEETVTVSLEGWTRGEPLPAISIGGTPLLELEAAGEHQVRGRTFSDGPGAVEVFAQTEQATALWEGTAERVLPTIERVEGRTLRMRSGPGDIGYVHAAHARLEQPVFTAEGEYWLDGPRGEIIAEVTTGADGTALFTLPDPFDPERAAVHVQAIVLPRGEPVESIEKRWSAVAQFP